MNSVSKFLVIIVHSALFINRTIEANTFHLLISFFRYPIDMSDRVNSDTNSDSCNESFYDPEVASDSEDFSGGDFNVIDDDEVDDINNIISLRMS